MAASMPEVKGVRHRYVDAGGLLMHVAEAGTGDPVVLLHGWPQHWYLWRHVIPELAKTRHVIAPDLRGFGWTEAPPGGYDKEQLATDVLNLLDVMDIDTFDLVGHDWGAFAGYLLALHRPERVRRYLAMAMTPPWGDAVPLLRNIHRFAYMAVLDKPILSPMVLERLPGFVRLVLILGVADPGTWTSEELSVFVDATRDPARAHAASALYRAFTTREVVPMLRGRYRDERLTVPTLLLVGERDPAIRPELIQGYEDNVDDMRVKVLPRTGHFMVDEAPGLVLEEMRAFFGLKEKRATPRAARRRSK
jgi:pimeloyl-ACP methyl ester carboxylesterase